MIKTISYAALALFLVSVPASVLAQNAPANDPATQPPATCCRCDGSCLMRRQKKTRHSPLRAKS